MGIFDSFFGAPAKSEGQTANPAVNPQASGVGNPQPVTGNGTNPIDPANPAAQQQPVVVEPKSALDTVKELWAPAKVDPNAPNPNDFLKIDPKAVFEQAGKMDLKQFITKEQLAAIASGGEGAVAAFADAMNRVGQASYASSAIAATEIAKQAVLKSQEQMKTQLPDMIKNFTVSDSLRQANPALTHEAVAPLVDMVKQQFVQKFPNASPVEISKMATDYMSEVGKAFNPTLVPGQTQDSSKQNGQPEQDWGKFFS